MMKKRSPVFILLIAAFSFYNCGKKEDKTAEEIHIQPDTIAVPEIPEVVPELVVKDTLVQIKYWQPYPLTYAVKPESLKGNLQFESSDTNIVTVSEGSVIPKNYGSAQVVIRIPHGGSFIEKEILVQVIPNPDKKSNTTMESEKKKAVVRQEKTVVVPKKIEQVVPKEVSNVEAPEKGKFRILSSPPFAQVWIDGIAIGETPMAEFHELNAGEHTLSLQHRNHPKKDTVFQLGPNEELKLKIHLDK